MAEQEINLTALQREWLERLRACEASGQGMKAFADAEGFKVKTLYSWRKVLVEKGVLPRSNSTSLVRAQVVKAAVSEWCIELPNGVSVAFAGEVKASSLAVVLKTASQLG